MSLRRLRVGKLGVLTGMGGCAAGGETIIGPADGRSSCRATREAWAHRRPQRHRPRWPSPCLGSTGPRLANTRGLRAHADRLPACLGFARSPVHAGPEGAIAVVRQRRMLAAIGNEAKIGPPLQIERIAVLSEDLRDRHENEQRQQNPQTHVLMFSHVLHDPANRLPGSPGRSRQGLGNRCRPCRKTWTLPRRSPSGRCREQDICIANPALARQVARPE